MYSAASFDGFKETMMSIFSAVCIVTGLHKCRGRVVWDGQALPDIYVCYLYVLLVFVMSNHMCSPGSSGIGKSTWISPELRKRVSKHSIRTTIHSNLDIAIFMRDYDAAVRNAGPTHANSCVTPSSKSPDNSQWSCSACAFENPWVSVKCGMSQTVQGRAQCFL